MGNKYNSSLDDVINDLTIIKKNILTEYGNQAKKDLEEFHLKIIDFFYSKHTPKSYKRHNHGGLYETLVSSCYKSNGIVGSATINVGNQKMPNDYKTDSANVFDLMWMHGLRGLPKIGINPIEKSFINYTSDGVKIWNPGDTWVNPFWSGENDPYHNIFRVDFNFRGLSFNHTPNKSMIYLVNNWDLTLDNKIIDKITNNIIKSIER